MGTEASYSVRHASGLVSSLPPGTLQPLRGHQPGLYRSHCPVFPSSTVDPVECISPRTCRAPELSSSGPVWPMVVCFWASQLHRGRREPPEAQGSLPVLCGAPPGRDELHPKAVGQRRAAKSSFVLSGRSGASGRPAWVIGSGEEAFLKVN